MDSLLASEILVRFQRDQDARRPAPDGDPVLRAEQQARVDADNLVWLRAVLRAGQWLSRELVGEQAAEAFFVLVQHADRAPALQREALDLLIEAADRGDVPRVHVALLTDRTLTHLGLPQRYGTQMERTREGDWVRRPVEQVFDLVERQRAMGLLPR